MKKFFFVFLMVLLCSGILYAQQQENCKFKMVLYGRIQSICNGVLQITTYNGQSAKVEPSPTAVYQDTSQSITAISNSSELRQGDEVVVVINKSNNNTHILFLHQGQMMDPGWQGTLEPLSGQDSQASQQQTQAQCPYPQYPSSQQSSPQIQYPSQQDSSCQTQQPQCQVFSYLFKLVLYGQVQSICNGVLQITTYAGQSAKVEPSPTAVFQDTSRPVSAVSSFSGIRQGDEVMLVVNKSNNNTHILFLHQGQMMDPSWRGTLEPPSHQ